MPPKGTRRKVVLKRRSADFELFVYYARRFGKLFLMMVLAIWLGAWFVAVGGVEKTRSWSVHKTLDLTAEMGFEVRNILVEGRENTDPELLKALINMEKGDPVFAFKPGRTRKMIEEISWVKSARVERRLPDTIYIGIEERKPLARWKNGDKLVVIDEEGEILTDKQLDSYRNLLAITGTDAPRHAAELLSMLSAEPEIIGRIDFADRIGGRRWNLHLKNGTDVLLPEKDIGLALRRLASAHEKGEILDKDLINIDLRNADRIIAKPRSGEAQTWQTGGNQRI